MKELGSWFNRKPDTLWTVAEALALDDLWEPSRQEFLALRSVYGGSTPKTRQENYLFRDLITLLNNWQKALDRAGYQEAPPQSSQPQMGYQPDPIDIPPEGWRDLWIKFATEHGIPEHGIKKAQDWRDLDKPLRKEILAWSKQQGGEN